MPALAVEILEQNLALNAALTLTDASRGLRLSGAKGVSLVVAASDGTSTINAVGKLKCYLWFDAAQAWVRCESLDIDMTAFAAGEVRQGIPSMTVPVPNGGITWQPSAMALTGGGTTVDILIHISHA